MTPQKRNNVPHSVPAKVEVSDMIQWMTFSMPSFGRSATADLSVIRPVPSMHVLEGW
jgi:hypothetical protein